MKVVRPLQNQFYGHRDVTLADPFGYLWTGVSVIEEMSVEEMHSRMKGLTQGPEGGKMPRKDEPKVSPFHAASVWLRRIWWLKMDWGCWSLLRKVLALKN